MADKKDHFAGSFAENYDRHMAPLIFDPYAADLAERLQVPAGGRVLETAAGTVLSPAFCATLCQKKSRSLQQI